MPSTPLSPPAARGISHLRRQAGWGVVANVLGLLLRFALILLIARQYGAHGVGIYSLSVALGLVASLAATIGMDWAVTRFVPFHNSRGESDLRRGIERTATRLVLGASIACALILALLSEPLAALFHDEALSRSLEIIALAVPGMALGQLMRARMRTSEIIRAAVLLEHVAIPGTNLVVVVAFLSLGSSRWIQTPVLGHTVGQLVAAMLAAMLLVRRPREGSSHRLALRPWFSYGVPMWAEASVLMLLAYADQLLLGHFVNVEKVGLYAPAARLAALVSVPLLAVNAVLGPMVARLDGSGARDELQRVYVRVNWATAAMGTAIGLALCVVGYPVLSLLGPQYVSAFPAFVVLVGGQVVASITGSAGTLLAGIGLSRIRLGNATAALILNVALGLLLIPRYELIGAAASTSIALAAVSLSQVLEVRAFLRMSTFDRAGGRYWVAQLTAWRRRP